MTAQYQALMQVRETIQLCQKLSQQSIPVLALKGGALSQLLYNDPARRASGDIDLLIDEPDLIKTHEYLLALGYRLAEGFSLTPERLERLKIGEKDLRYQHPTSSTPLELHWRLELIPGWLNIPFTTLWQARQTILIQHYSMPTLSVEDYFLYVCQHGAKHMFYRMQWLEDVGALLKKYPDLEWQKLWQRAQALGVDYCVLLGVGLVHSMLSLPIPTFFQVLLQDNKKVERLQQLVLKQGFAKKRADWRFYWYYYWINPRWRFRFSWCLTAVRYRYRMWLHMR